MQVNIFPVAKIENCSEENDSETFAMEKMASPFFFKL